MGARVTYTGDQPFLLRLILGITKDDGNDHPSKIPLYLSEECNQKITPWTVHPESKQRTDVEITFRRGIPKTSLIYFDHIGQVSIDGTHARARIVECDLAKWVNKIIKEKSDECKRAVAIQRLESALSEREVKRPFFKFSIKNNKCEPISLSGTESDLVIAEREELGDSVTSNLFQGVWLKSERIKFVEQSDCHMVLKKLQPDLIGMDGYIAISDAAELWRKSLNAIFQLLRNKRTFNSSDFKLWTEIYYQICLTVFDTDVALTPYKLKIILLRNIFEAGYINLPWNHLTEALEKSNHHSQKDFYTKTMMNGGKLHHHDPKFMELYFAFSRILSFTMQTPTRPVGELEVPQTIANFLDAYYQLNNDDCSTPAISYSDIVGKVPPAPKLDLGAEREKRSLLLGMRFLVLGHFVNTTQKKLEASIKSLGGQIMSMDSALLLLRKHSCTPHCYVVLQDDKVLQQATFTDKNPTGNLALAKNIQTLAGGDWKFLKSSYFFDTEKHLIILDTSQYEMKSGKKVVHRVVKDIRPLLKRQRTQHATSGDDVSTRVHVKRFRNNYKELDFVSSSESESCDEGSDKKNSTGTFNS